ncbi:hypothetical protein JST56_04350 [Candidatus Dependentiae bacterium]|nr:hypothetical protein [Candidatus Dependentiae bacterium]
MNFRSFKIMGYIAVLACTPCSLYPVISAEEVTSYFASLNPHEINPETFLEELVAENPELACIIQENSLLEEAVTPLMIAHTINPDWLPVLFTLKSNGMDIVRDLCTRVTQRVHNQQELAPVPTYAANFIQRQADRILGSLQQILGFASQEDFEKHCNNSFFMTTFRHSPIDAAGNSVLNYALHYQDKTFEAILTMYPATKSNPEFKEPIQPLE